MSVVRSFIWAFVCVLTVVDTAFAAGLDQFQDRADWPHWALEERVESNGSFLEAVRWELIRGEVRSGRRVLRPQAPVTRAEAAIIVARALGSNSSGNSAGIWYESAQETLSQYNISIGDPKNSLSRLELAQWILSILQVYGLPVSAFPVVGYKDMESIAREGQVAVRTVGAFRIMIGYEDQTFRPGAVLTRTEAAIVAIRLAKFLTKKAPSLDELTEILKAEWRAREVRERTALLSGGDLEFTASRQHYSPLFLFDPNGVAQQQTIEFVREGHLFRVLEEITAEPIVLSDGIASVQTNVRLSLRSSEGLIQRYQMESAKIFFAKQEGRWAITAETRIPG